MRLFSHPLAGRCKLANADGSLYFEQWALTWPWPWCIGAHVHRMQNPDLNTGPHPHAWPFVVIMLRGGYTEEVHIDDGLADVVFLRTWKAPSVHVVRMRESHRVVAVRATTWTVCLNGIWRRRGRGWIRRAVRARVELAAYRHDLARRGKQAA